MERYLEACLESIVTQTYVNLEILLVDDGSTDDSLSIAEGFAARDGRIRIIKKRNAGLGAARNTGINEATGTFLAFADSDDLVPKDAYSSMLSSLNASGSDFAVGSLNRLIGSKREMPAWAKQIHSKTRSAIQIDDYPEVLQDVFAWNKVFRKDFWHSKVQAFPEGILYEDQEPTARAYLHASKFDVLSEVVYDWRIREDRSSITQKKDTLKDLSDRLQVCISTRHLLDAHASATVLNAWLAKVLGPDLGQYYAQIPRTSHVYWEALKSGVEVIAQDLSPAVLAELNVNYRVLVHLILAGARDDAIKVAVHQSEYGSKFPILPFEDLLVARPKYLGLLETKIPDSVLDVSPDKLKIVSRITSIIQTAPRSVTIGGFAYIEGLSTDPSMRISANLIDKHSGHRIKLVSKMLPGLDIDHVVNDPWSTYSHAYFEAVIDLDKTFAEGMTPVADSEWALTLTIQQSGQSLSGIVKTRDTSGTAATLPLLSVRDNTRFVFRFSQELGLSLLPMRYKRFVHEASVSGREVKLRIALPEGEIPSIMRMECPSVKISRDVAPAPGDGFEFKFVLPEVPTNTPTKNIRWKIRVGTGNGKFYHLAWAGTSAELQQSNDRGQSVTLKSTGYGYIEIYDRPWQVIAQSIDVSPDATCITVEGTASYSDASAGRIFIPRLVLASDHSILEPTSVAWKNDNRFSVDFTVVCKREGYSNTAPESGLYTLRALPDSTDIHGALFWVPVSWNLEQSLPFERSNHDVRIRVSRTPKAGALAVTFSPPFAQNERGKLRQTRLQAEIPSLMKKNILTGATMFESFGGSALSDSGLGLFNEMIRRGDESPKFWSVKDASVPVPEGAERLIRYSHRWYDILHTAEYVVNNNNFPFFYRKHPGQTYIQTWHGTPLKRIAKDIPSSSLSLAYLSLMDREANYWDYLLAQNNFAATTLPPAFGYDGEVLNLGYPRNDSLVSGTSQIRRESVRESLGLKPEDKVVLYAPTWRDNVRTFNNRYMLANFLDPSEAARILGPDYVFLLRGHINVSSGRNITKQQGLIDVTSYPDINDLFLAADILVTDYSSVMFDFCVTQKPIYFLTPDLNEYRDNVRGFYFDFEAAAPGPLCSNTQDLALAIRDDESSFAYADSYANFRLRFAPKDDGNASKRVYEHIWKK